MCSLHHTTITRWDLTITSTLDDSNALVYTGPCQAYTNTITSIHNINTVTMVIVVTYPNKVIDNKGAVPLQ